MVMRWLDATVPLGVVLLVLGLGFLSYVALILWRNRRWKQPAKRYEYRSFDPRD